ncbi:MAG: O-acetyl-ADP-ribose deacetylase (regulator of RNase III) [Candidatus Omnitrophota bacterium]
MQINKTLVEVVHADITTLKVDAIVNAANNEGHMGGGVAKVIRDKGGVVIEEEALKQGPFEIGGAIYTTAGDLSASYIIHAATMGMDFNTDEHKLRQACVNALKVADELGVKSIAFPALGCGIGNFPLIGSVKIMTQEILKYTRRNDGSLEEITLCFYDKKAYELADKTARGYLRHVIENLGPEPYYTVDIIIEVPDGVVLIERSNPPYGWALPGGFVDPGETLQQGAIREAREETNLDLENVKEFNKYSDKDRDPRFHTISTVFTARGVGEAHFGDDAKGLKIIAKEDLLNNEYAFDHHKIIQDYLNSDISHNT